MSGGDEMKKCIIILLLMCNVTVAETIDNDNTQDGSLNTSNIGSTVSSNNTTTDTSSTTTNNGAGAGKAIPPPSAISPSYMSNGVETCLQGASGSISTSVVGLSGGKFKADENCNRRRDTKVLSDLGMKVAAVARMCQDLDVWRSMFISGTPCPILARGKLLVGKRAYLAMKSSPELYIPDYGFVIEKKGDHRVCELKKGKRTCRTIDPATISKYTATQEWYNKILGIGETNETETDENGSGMSISERFRSGSDS